MQFSPNEIRERILKETSMSQEDLQGRLESKLQELKGVISEYGALCIIAGEEGLKLYKDKVSDSPQIKLKNLLGGLNNISVIGKVVNIYPTREFETKDKRKGRLVSFLINDGTSSTKAVFWNDKTKLLDNINEGDVIRIEGVNVKDNNNNLEIHSNQSTLLHISDEVIDTSDSFELFNKDVYELSDSSGSEEVILRGKLVSAFTREPFYDACPECNKRVAYEGDSFVCSQHGKIKEPKHNFILNALFDDGSGIIKTTFFGRSAERLLSKSADEAYNLFKSEPQKLEHHVKDMLGKDITLRVKVNQNKFTNNKEALVQRVFTNPNYVKKVNSLLVSLS